MGILIIILIFWFFYTGGRIEIKSIDLDQYYLYEKRMKQLEKEKNDVNPNDKD